MRLVIALALLIPTGAPAAPITAGSMPTINSNPNAAKSGICPPTSRYEAARRGGKLMARKLAELPAADMYKAVWRMFDGCEVPIIAAYGLGAVGRQAPTRHNRR